MSKPAVDSTRTVPVGRDSLLVRYAGDWRSLLPVVSAGMLQVTHPALGAGLSEHSKFREESLARLVRSLPQIWGTILGSDDEVAARARNVRDAHREIKGVDHHGHRYHALEPEVYWWGHATFTWQMFRSIELFHHRVLSDRELESLYADTVDWYALYGVSARPVPPDYAAFCSEFDRICTHVLEVTPLAESLRIGHGSRYASSSTSAGLSHPAQAATNVIKRQLVVLGVGCLPEGLRERLEIQWTSADRRRFAALSTAVRHGFRPVPSSLNRASLSYALRTAGALTREGRLRPPASQTGAPDSGAYRANTAASNGTGPSAVGQPALGHAPPGARS